MFLAEIKTTTLEEFGDVAEMDSGLPQGSSE